jgi:hypothetical protein
MTSFGDYTKNNGITTRDFEIKRRHDVEINDHTEKENKKHNKRN